MQDKGPGMARTIVFYSDSTDYGGSEVYLINLISHLDRSRYRPVCIYLKSKFSYRLRNALKDTKKYELSRMQMWLRTAHILLREKPDIIHLNMHVPFSCFFFIFISKVLRFKNIVASVHSVIAPVSKFPFIAFVKKTLCHLLLPCVGTFICGTKVSKKEFIERYHVPEGRVEIINYGMEIKTRRSFSGEEIAAIKDKIGIDRKNIIIGTVTRLVRDKGVEYLLEAFASFVKRTHDCSCLVVGEGKSLEGLKSLSMKSNIADSVFFTGFIEDIQTAFAVIDIFILPSFHETFGLSILEAMLAGKPVIASNVGGIPELVDNGVTGILVPPKNADAIEKAVSDLVTDKEKMERMGQKGRKRAIELFSLEKMVDGTQNIYNRIGIK